MKYISPKKYIETRVRNLPVYKCFVNPNWESAKMVYVIILRKHVNGNMTAGIYLIDLLCLGVKDTMFIFNQPEDKMMEGFPNFEESLIEVEYTLAHNIVYAGHDFALEYDIQPHQDFKITRFILEEDNDDIPLIDIAVGDENGIPSLILPPGQSFKYRHVFEKLEKKLGKGNFNFHEEEDDEYEDDDEDECSSNIEDYEIGGITPYNVQFIEIEDLLNKDKHTERNPLELSVIEAELKLRMLRMVKPDLFSSLDVEDRVEFNDIEYAQYYPESFTEEMEAEYDEMFEENIEILEQAMKGGIENIEFQEQQIIGLLKKYANNPLIVSDLLEESIAFKLDKAIEQSKILAKRMAMEYPIAKLSLALCSAIMNTEDSLVAYILKGKDIHSVFPLVETFSEKELYLYWIANAIYSLQVDNLRDGIYFYEMAAETKIQSTAMIKLLELLIERMNKKYREIEDLPIN